MSKILNQNEQFDWQVKITDKIDLNDCDFRTFFLIEYFLKLNFFKNLTSLIDDILCTFIIC